MLILMKFAPCCAHNLSIFKSSNFSFGRGIYPSFLFGAGEPGLSYATVGVVLGGEVVPLD